MPLLRVLGYLTPYRGLFLAALGSTGLGTLLELVPPWLLKSIIDDVIQARRVELLPLLLGGYIAVHLGKSVLSAICLRFYNRIDKSIMHDLRMAAFAAVQRQSVGFFESRSTGDLLSRITNDTDHMQRVVIDGLDAFIASSLTLVGIAGVLLFLNWKLALLAMVPIPLLLVANAAFHRHAQAVYARIRQSAADMTSHVQDTLAGIREVMGFAREDYEQTRFEGVSREYREASLRANYLWSVYWPGISLVGAAGTGLILWFGAREVMQGALSVGELVMFLGYLGLFYAPIDRLNGLNDLWQQTLAASRRIFELLDAQPEVQERSQAHAPAVRLTGAVEYDHVDYRYRADVPAIQDLTLSVRPGEHIALVGPSGAGKSTALKLLLRFYDVGTGAIRIDGVDIRDLPLRFLRSQIGLVQQEPFLFNGTIRDNLAYGDLTATTAAIETAASLAQAHDFIAALPDGYETAVGERGVRLSVGQKQRLAMARVLLKNPPIVIFDEATSNLDTETELRIRQALLEITAGRTTFMIAHRLSTIQDADRIVVLQQGRIVEIGRHEELLARAGVYRTLCEAQFNDPS